LIIKFVFVSSLGVWLDPLRIEYPGAYYHVTSRGNEQKAIFKDDSDREKFLDIVARAVN